MLSDNMSALVRNILSETFPDESGITTFTVPMTVLGSENRRALRWDISIPQVWANQNSPHLSRIT